jgi:uncharacterized protein with HEPN domain
MRRTSLHFLDDIREAARNIRKYTAGMSYEQFLADRRTRDAVIRNFEVIGEATKNLPDDVKDRYPGVAWKTVAGLRDIVAHGYYRIDYEVIWGIITDRLPGFGRDIAKILKEESRREKESRK